MRRSIVQADGRAPWDPALVSEIIAEWVDAPGGLLPLLQALQARFAYVPDAAVPMVAEALNLSRAEVHGVLTFYHDFRRAPTGRHVVKLCRAEACQARGGRAVDAALRRMLGIDFGETTSDGAVTLETAYCLGLCASGPAALVDDVPVGRLDGARLGPLVEELQR
jgi:formate dehydrogenase subunit gamma